MTRFCQISLNEGEFSFVGVNIQALIVRQAKVVELKDLAHFFCLLLFEAYSSFKNEWLFL